MGNIVTDRSGNLVKVEYNFMTMNNKVDPAQLDISKGECPSLINVFPTARGGIITRPGYTQINSANYRYSWSTGAVGYLVTSTGLYTFDGTDITLIASISDSQYHDFCQVNDVVVYTNTIDYLIIQDNQVFTPTPVDAPFKVAPVAGSCLEYYNGRVYIAKDNSLYCTDPFTTEWMDERQYIVSVFESPITMINRVDDGLYVSTKEKLYYLSGDDPYVGEGFNTELILDFPVIWRSAIVTYGDRFVAAEMQGSIIIFATTQGICVAGNGGNLKNLSYDKISYDFGNIASANLLEYNGQLYYILTMDADNEAVNTYTIPSFEVDQSEV